MFFDVHAHVNFNAFKEDGDEIIKKSLDNNVWMVLVGAEYKTSKRALDYANKYEKGVYASVGLQPVHLFPMRAESKDKEKYDFLTRGERFEYSMFENLAKMPKTVAIGEIGLDYYHIPENVSESKMKDAQKEAFWEQLELAHNMSLPSIIHCRNAHNDNLEILKNFKKKYKKSAEKPWGVVHSFSGDEDLAWEYFGLGLVISFNGIITFASTWDDLIRKMPLDKLLLETDCPFLTPVPFRGKRNEPSLVKYTAQRVAQIRGVSLESIAKKTTENAKRFFNVK